MSTLPKVELRGKKWRMSEDPSGCYWLHSTGDPKGIRYPDDLSAEEISIVKASWKLEIDDRQRINELAMARFKTREKEINRLLAKGDAWIRNFPWHVEHDHIWRIGSLFSEKDKKWILGRLELKFSQLTNDELAGVMQAKEREVLNRGLGGFFRKIARKLDDL